MTIQDLKHIKLFVLLLLLINNPLFAQSKSLEKEEMEVFLLGMFNHYSADTYVPSHPVLKDKLTFFLKENFFEIFKDSLSVYAQKNNFLYSIKQKDLIRVYKLQQENPFLKYYTQKRNNDSYHSDPESDELYELYHLHLQKKAFTNKEMKLYFLLGAFINDGEVVSDNYIFTSGNTNYIDFIQELLKDLKIKIIEVKEPKKNYTGSVKKITFKPSGEFEILLQQNEKLWKK